MCTNDKYVHNKCMCDLRYPIFPSLFLYPFSKYYSKISVSIAVEYYIYFIANSFLCESSFLSVFP